jgi:hypothetical protein
MNLLSECSCGRDNCEYCVSGRSEAQLLWQGKQDFIYLKPVHIVNELITPEVQYDSWQEFVHLIYSTQDVFCDLLAKSIHKEFATQHQSPVLGSVFCRTPTLEHMKRLGPGVIMRLTKGKGDYWCSMVSHFVCARALRAAAIFEDVSATIADTISANLEMNCTNNVDIQNLLSWEEHERKSLVINIMQQEVRHTFSGAMPFSIYTLCSGFVSTLLVKNFTFYEDKQLTAFTHEQFRTMLLTLCMGLHPRLGEHSALLVVTNDIMRLVCASLCASQLQKHIVFHTQEQWLY